jgi:two-component system, LuxR family, response regulator FixJ
LALPPLIAIVEDDAEMRDALADLIEVFGFEARAFDSSESFLAAHAPGLFGCLVTDLNLAGESGLQLQQRLLALEPSLPVIVISAQASPDARALALDCGALAYLTKPINDQVLLRHLVQALGPAASRV